jgi:two-component system, cell cycle sensor histidine kinase and response regulator CckA
MTMDADDRRRDDLIEVQKSCQRAASLTRQLLAFSRRQSLDPRVLDINELVMGTQKLLRRTIGEDIEIVMALNAVEPVRVDPAQFEQVLLNLALNARDAMPTGGQLRFLTESVNVDDATSKRYPPMTQGRYVRVTVTDTGIGMSVETQAHIFEPFFTTKPAGKGTGLGLATAYGIVKQSDGFIWVDSRDGGGTGFMIYLPVVDAPVEQAVVASGERGPVVGGSETILLVEDDGAVRRLANHTLSYHGYTVLDARDGEHALELSEQHRGAIQLLVTDVVMPGLSGPALANQLRAERPTLRVLYTSGYAEGVTARAGAGRGKVPLLNKPFLPVDLLWRVREALNANETGG